ncbi:uncharacterized SAM-binding protein YcdF (DUF218 family) [Lactobacillus colini]|uniref:Uncharacterized SAM-binding protein YcdF (DUF218 family) n=1 Tax=Lactobacillus colini TaxID=1819254 RepID=A0ABS4ME39_9LACO|nr:YdcF family protein [Lactobacillus colini]MBP2057948.1 uncharacterized SAM-binding protein YcdF (DUF218 family) [Lactobacillus colini]
MVKVLGLIFVLFLLTLASFIYVLFHERRTLWSGMTFTATLMMLMIWILVLLTDITDLYYKQNQWVLNIFIFGLLAILLSIALFIFIIIVMFVYNGIKIIFKEGNHWTNYLSLGFGIFLIFFIFGYPNIVGRIYINDWVTYIYAFIILSTLYILYIMVMYIFTAWVNLINRRHPHLNYVVVLGAGLINGDQVSPLLANRIKRGVEIMKKNPGSKIILSGGQGKNELIPEAAAMATYAKQTLGISDKEMILEKKSRTTNENIKFSHQLMPADAKFCLVTNSYHVYRALVLAKKQGLKCIGYGAKTKWYFTLNAFIREFIAYIVITKRLQITMVSLIGLLCLIAAIFDNIINNLH